MFAIWFQRVIAPGNAAATASDVPATAILDTTGDPILDTTGAYITES